METTSKQTNRFARASAPYATFGQRACLGELGLLTPPSGTPLSKQKRTNKSVCWLGKQPTGWTQQASKQSTKQSEDVQLSEGCLMLDLVKLLCEAVRELQCCVAVLKGDAFTLAHLCNPAQADAVSLC